MLTEGLFYEPFNIFTDTTKVFMYFCIWYSDNRQSVFFKKSCSFFIILLSFFCIMPRTVKLYDELCLCTVKICDLLTENLLARKTHQVDYKKSKGNQDRFIFAPSSIVLKLKRSRSINPYYRILKIVLILRLLNQ